MADGAGRLQRGGWRGGGRGPARVQVRSRIALIAAGAVALAVVLVAVTAYAVVRSDLLGGVDRSLARAADRLEQERSAHQLARAFESLSVPSEAPSVLSAGQVAQVVGTTGIVVARTRGARPLPVPAAAREVAEGRRGGYLVTATSSDAALGLLVRRFGQGLALEIASPVSGIDAELGRLADVLAVAAVCGVVIALGLGAAVSGLALRPVRRLTAAAEEVAASQDLSRRLPSEGRDELSRLAASINTLLESLERAEVSQRQLVADASHELRTPLASLRTNVELLMGSGAGGGQGPSEPGGPVRRLDSEAKRQLAFDVVRQFDRVGTLVGDLVELARQDRRARVPAKLVELDLAALVGDVLDEQTVHHPEVEITSSLAAARVRGVAADLERVVANLVDNAAKWSPEGGVVEVTLRSGSTAQLTVRDHGSGIDPADLTHVFDRFYRGRSAGTVPGSGLGLAIVRRIVDVHNGTVAIESAPGRGTTVEVHLPLAGGRPQGA